MSTNEFKVSKPQRATNAKSSDRRLASGVRPEMYLKSEQAKVGESKLSDAVLASTRTASPSPSTLPHTKSTHNNDWDPKHFRLFVGNLGSDATDALLLKAFQAYASVTKVSVPMDHKKGENKGFGFVAFSDPNDYLKAFKEVNGKYIGHHPCVLKKANDLKGKGGGNGNNRRR